ncbi:hypothetical protein PENTCL1PPCAC_27937, partial [Pristionchus entomophagus]
SRIRLLVVLPHFWVSDGAITLEQWKGREEGGGGGLMTKKNFVHNLFRSSGDGESDALVAVVEDRVELADEDVTEDPEGTCGRRDVHAHESGDALGDSGVGHLEDIVLALKHEVLSSEVEGDIGEVGDVVATDHELAGLAEFASSDCVVDLVHDVGGSGEERSAGVDDGGDGSLGVGDSAHLHLSQVDPPVVLCGERLPCDLSHIVSGISSTEGHLSSVLVGEASVQISVEPEGEDGLGAVILVGPDLVHGLRETINGDRVPSHSEDSVESGGDESESGLGHGASESLGFVRAVARLVVAELDDVIDDVSGHGSGSILDREGDVGFGVGAGFGAIVLVVGEAGDVGGGAALARHPQVGGAGIEESLELLSGRSDGDVTVVLSLQKVGETLLVDEAVDFVALDALLLEVLGDDLGLVRGAVELDLVHRHSVDGLDGDDRQKADDGSLHG